MPSTPTNAFAWLLEEFHRYTRNEITWLQVRQVLQVADNLRDEFQGMHHPWFGPCDANLPEGGCSECAAIARGDKSRWQLLWESQQNM